MAAMPVLGLSEEAKRSVAIQQDVVNHYVEQAGAMMRTAEHFAEELRKFVAENLKPMEPANGHETTPG